MPEEDRKSLEVAFKYQTVAVGGSKASKRLIVAGNIYTTAYRPPPANSQRPGSTKTMNIGFQNDEIKLIGSIIRKFVSKHTNSVH